MTAIQARATHIPAPAGRLSFVRQLRSEFIKLITVRGTWWSVVIVAAITIGIAFIATSAMSAPVDNMVMAVVSPVRSAISAASACAASGNGSASATVRASVSQRGVG